MAIICYIVSISLQLAGALMLIVFAFSTKRENVIRAFARSHMITQDGNTKELSYNHEAFIETYKTAYYTQISVIFISVGYLLSIFGNIGDKLLSVISFYLSHIYPATLLSYARFNARNSKLPRLLFFGCITQQNYNYSIEKT